MNPPHRSAVPGYGKWYFGAGGSPGRRGMEAAPDPDPLPFEAIRIHDERTVGPPSTSADGYSAHGTFTIPEGAEGKKLYGTCSLFLGVDDWGILEVKDSGGKVVAQVDLKENPQTAGEQVTADTQDIHHAIAPLSIALSEFHLLSLYAKKLVVHNLLSHNVVYERESGVELRGLCPDCATGCIWVYGERELFRVCEVLVRVLVM